jgi:hypothetical protein
MAPATAPTLREKAAQWQASRKDVRGSTTIQHRTALGRVLPILGTSPVDAIRVDDVQELVDALVAEGKARETIRKSRTALAMVLDYVRVRPNPARDRLVRLPLEEPAEVEPPIAEHVEAVAWLLPANYLIARTRRDRGSRWRARGREGRRPRREPESVARASQGRQDSKGALG